jgi:hypothetical protein
MSGGRFADGAEWMSVLLDDAPVLHVDKTESRS